MSDTATLVPIGNALAHVSDEVDRQLQTILPTPEGPERRLFEAMRYATLAGGKRFRPFLCVASSMLFQVPRERALRAGAAVELIHSYSLIHDDLPAMDDDDLRRGQPSCHIQFDEATAILAGDALQALAFEVLSDPRTHPDASVRVDLVRGLAIAAGGPGMVGGQMIDLECENAEPPFEVIRRMHRLKTGALISYSCQVGGILGRAGKASRDALTAYAADIGLAFQIADDLLDAEGDASDIGKTTGKDAAAGKATFVSALGLEGARREARSLADQAVGRLDAFGAEADLLRAVAHFVVDRRS